MMTSKVLKKKVIEQRSSLGVKFCNTTKEQLFLIRLKGGGGGRRILGDQMDFVGGVGRR